MLRSFYVIYTWRKFTYFICKEMSFIQINVCFIAIKGYRYISMLERCGTRYVTINLIIPIFICIKKYQ